MKKFRRPLSLLSLVLAACSSTVAVKVPPRMILDRNQTIGILTFKTDGAQEGDPDITSKFIQAVQSEQTGVAIVELGTPANVLKEVHKTDLTAEMFIAVGKKHKVDFVIVGDLKLKTSKPKIDVDLQQGLKLDSVQAQIRLDGSLSAKMINTSRGATIWSGSSSLWINLANVGGNALGAGTISLPDRERQVEKLYNALTVEATEDFRSTWERQPKKK